MSTRSRSARKSAATDFSYAEPASSGDEGEGGALDDDGRGGGASRSNTKAPTKRRKSKVKAVEVDSGDEGDEDDKPRKKSRGSAKGKQSKQSKQKKGTSKLEVLKKLPVEMITEICSHLDPDGLLALSMVNKQYRSLLLAKSSARLWKSARARFDLPDSTAGGFTEWQYAQLMFGKTCQECGVGKVARADFGVRKRLCKACRTSSMVRFGTKDFRRLDFHPLAKDCVIRPLHSPALLKWMSTAQYGFVNDLEYYSDSLWELERAVNLEQHERRGFSTGASNHRRQAHALGAASYKETSDDEGTAHSPGPGAKDFVAARQPLLDQLRKEGITMFKAARNLREKLRARQVQQLSFADRMKQMDRADQIAEKVLELDPTFGDCVYSSMFSSNKIVKREEPLTDDEWERIKPAILKLVVRIKKKQDRDAMNLRLQDRQRSLRPRYDKLKDALPPSARPFVPLFIDFLALSSVKALWQDETVKLDDATWSEHLDDVKEELDQYRLDLAMHARELIAAAAHDPDEPSSSSAAPDEDEFDLSDDFFKLASSLVSCGVPDCHLSASRTGAGPAPVARSAQQSAEDEDERAMPVGSLENVLRHLHKEHNGATFITTAKHFGDEPRLPLSLPLEVSCAVSALLDLAKLDPATATFDDLGAFTAIVREYKWENSPKHRWFSAWRDPEKPWLDLLCVVKIEADRAAKLSPPQSLDPPIIACTLRDPRDWQRLPIRPATPTTTAAKKVKAKVKNMLKPKRERMDDDSSDFSMDDDDDDERERVSQVEVDEEELASEGAADDSS
ncbi:hypothetical protein JCM9279_000409 [Rhodotorula babjevae]